MPSTPESTPPGAGGAEPVEPTPPTDPETKDTPPAGEPDPEPTQGEPDPTPNETRLLAEKQAANREAQGYRETLDAIATATGTTRQELKPGDFKALASDAEFARGVREALGDAPGETEPAEFVRGLIAAKATSEASDGKLQGLLDQAKEGLSERLLSHVPADKPLVEQLLFVLDIRESIGSGPSLAIGNPPPRHEPDPRPTITTDVKNRAERSGRTPESQLSVEEKRERFRQTGSPGGVEALLGQH